MQVTQRLNEGENIYKIDIPLNLSVMKPVHAKCIIGLYDHIRNNEYMVIKAFEMSGLTEALSMELEHEDPYFDLTDFLFIS